MKFLCFLVERGAPLVLLAVLFPFLAGLITGNSSAAIGLHDTLFLSVIPAAAGSIPYYNLVYIAAATSYLTSPFHMCLLLTAEYYQASIPRVIKQVAFVSRLDPGCLPAKICPAGLGSWYNSHKDTVALDLGVIKMSQKIIFIAPDRNLAERAKRLIAELGKILPSTRVPWKKGWL